MHGLLRVNAIVIYTRYTSAVPWLSLLPCTQFIFIFNKLMIDQLTFHAVFIIFK